MLSLLHQKINDIVPIIGIQNDNGNYLIEYENPETLTQDELDEVANILASWPIESEKILKLKNLDLWWNDQIRQGFPTSFGWRLGLRNEDVTLLMGAFLLSKEAALIGLSDQASIMDQEGVSHTVSVSDMTNMMLQYGQYRSQLSASYADKKQQIQNCASLEEIQNIVL